MPKVVADVAATRRLQDASAVETTDPAAVTTTTTDPATEVPLPPRTVTPSLANQIVRCQNGTFNFTNLEITVSPG